MRNPGPNSAKSGTWHPEDIKAAVRKRGSNLQELALCNGFERTTFHKALHVKFPRPHRIIADFIGVGMDVNETRRDDQTGGVNLLVGAAGDLADLNDATVLDGDVSEESGVARAIHNATIADEAVELRGGRSVSESEEQQTGQESVHEGVIAMRRAVQSVSDGFFMCIACGVARNQV